MSKSARRSLAFDNLEGKVLLSTGMADPSAAVHVAKVKPFLLNGTFKGIPFGSVHNNGIQVSSFIFTGTARSMGKVTGSLAMADPLIAPGKMPDLGNATLTLSNARGSVQLKIAASLGQRHIFVLTSGSGSYSSDFGSGTVGIAYGPRVHEYLLTVHSINF